MKTNHNLNFLQRKTIFGFSAVLFILYSHISNAQISIQTTVPAGGLEVCQPEQEFLVTITNGNASTYQNVSLQIQLPNGGAGIIYEGFNVVASPGWSYNTASTSSLLIFDYAYTITNNTAPILLYYKLRTTCDIIDFLPLTGLVSNQTTLLESNVPVETEQFGTSSYNVKYPDIYLSVTNNQTQSGYVGQTLTRTIRIRNSGNGSLSSIDLNLMNPAELDPVSIKIGAANPIPVTSNTFNITLQGGDLGADNFLTTNEDILIIETVKVIACLTAIETTYSVEWGCDGSVCNAGDNDAVANSYVNIMDGRPFFTRSFSVGTGTDFCGTAGTFFYSCANDGHTSGIYEPQDAAKNVTIGFWTTNGLVPVLTTNDIFIKYNPTGTYIALSTIPGISLSHYAYQPITDCFRDYYTVSFAGVAADPDGANYGLSDLDADGFDDMDDETRIDFKFNYSFNCPANLTQCTTGSPPGTHAEFMGLLSCTDLCGTPYQYNEDGYKFLNYKVSVSSSGNTDLSNQQTGQYKFVSSGGYFLNQGGVYGCSMGYKAVLTLPGGLAPSAVKWNLTSLTGTGPVNNGNGTYSYTYIITTNTNNGNGNFNFDLTLNCAAAPGPGFLAIDYKIYETCASCTGCDFLLGKGNTDVYAHCFQGGGPCDLRTTSFEVLRSTFGYSKLNTNTVTHNGLSGLFVPASIAAALTDGMNLKKAMECDYIQATVHGHVLGCADISTNDVTVQIAYTPLIPINGANLHNFLTFVSGEWFKNSAGQGSFNTPPNVISGSINGSVPDEVIFEFVCPSGLLNNITDLDLVANFKIEKSADIPDQVDIELIHFRGMHIGHDNINIDIGGESWGDRFYITKPITSFGWQVEYPNQGCELETYLYTYNNCSTMGDLFPNELRILQDLPSINFEVPAGYTYKTGSSESHDYANGSWTPVLNPSGTANLTWLANSGTWPVYDTYSDQYKRVGALHFTLERDCQTPDSWTSPPVTFSYDYTKNYYSTILPNNNCSSSETWTSPGVSIYYNKPKPVLSANNIVDGIQSTVEWTIFIAPGGEAAENSWIEIDPWNTVGTITNFQINEDNTVYNNIMPGVVTPILNVAFPTTKIIKLRATYSGCVEGAVDIVKLYYGWDCDARPASHLTAKCTPQEVDLKLRYHTADMRMIVTSPEPNPICSNVPFTVTITDPKIGYMSGINLDITLPEYVSIANCAINGDYGGVVPLTFPVVPPCPFTGGGFATYHFDLSADLLSGNNPIGDLPGITGNNTITLTFDAYATCDYDPSQPLTFDLHGVTNCGDIINLTFQKKIQIAGLPQFEQTNISVTPISIYAGGTASGTVTITNPGIPTGPNSFFNMILPQGVTLTSATPSPINGPTGLITWQILPSIPNNGTFTINFDIDGTGLVPCLAGVSLPCFTTQLGNALCISFNCNMTITTGSTTGIFNILPPDVILCATNVKCSDGSGGSITSQVLGGSGTANYQYTWTTTNGSIIPAQVHDPDLDPVTAGTYTLTFTDNGYSCPPVVKSITVTTPTVYITMSNLVTCSASGAEVNALAGIITSCSSPQPTSYTYTWYSISGNVWTQIQAPSSEPAGTASTMMLQPGNYVVTAIDNYYLCTGTVYFTVAQAPPLVVNFDPHDPHCFGDANGYAQVNVTGGTPPVTYLWSNSYATGWGGNLLAGTYTVTVSDAGGCSVSGSFTLTDPLPISMTVTNVTPCGAQATVTGGVGPYNFIWNLLGITVHTDYNNATGVSLQTPLDNGDYQIIVTDAANCSFTQNTTINFNPTPLTFDMCFRWVGNYHPDPPPCDDCWPDPGIVYTPLQESINLTTIALNNAINSCQDAQIGEIKALAENACTDVDNVHDHMLLDYDVHYQHYTLYYYDRAGNLVRTVPPKGVVIPLVANRNTPSASTMVTEYNYNSLHQLNDQTTPDAGQAQFLYDDKGQLRFSQNAHQAAIQTFSYTKYDNLGRIVEVGQSTLPSVAGVFADLKNYPALLATSITDPFQSFPSPAFTAGNATIRSDLTFTIYNTLFSDINYEGNSQQNLQNRISYTYTSSDGSDGIDTTFYSYDVHGNVEWLAQSIHGFGRRYMKYEYDLISNKVNRVKYNEYDVDKFYHRYAYDENNRIIQAETSEDGVLWERDVDYTYYKHGPLHRTHLGQDHIQGLDYTYTINGWLKSINFPDINSAASPDPDYTVTTSSYPRDVFAMSLGYFQGDYANTLFGAGLNAANAYLATTNVTGYAYSAAKNDLYNGNISSWVSTTNHALGGNDIYDGQMTRNLYRYDELNRIKESGFQTYASSAWNNNAANLYSTAYDYDPNGNLLAMNRTNQSGAPMDNLTYAYSSPFADNKLNHVADASGQVNGYDLDNQLANNYSYDEIGDLTGDVQEAIQSIEWTVYGKVKKITRVAGSIKDDILFRYDAAGNRIMKLVKPKTPGGQLKTRDFWEYTYYVRDASGNIMAVYSRQNNLGAGGNYNVEYKLKEQPIYGSDRIGMRQDNITVAVISDVAPADVDNDNIWFDVLQTVSLVENKTQLISSTNFAQTSQVSLYDVQSASNTVIETFSGSVGHALAVQEDDAHNILFSVVVDQDYNGALDVCRVYDKNNLLMWNPGFVTLLASSACKPVTMRVPGNTSLYYIFTVDISGNLLSHIVDLSKKGNALLSDPPLGEIVQAEANQPIGIDNGNYLAIFDDQRPGKASVLYTSRYNLSLQATELIYYTIDENGIHGPVLFDNINAVIVSDGKGEFQIKRDGSELAGIFYTDYNTGWNNYRPAEIHRWALDADHYPIPPAINTAPIDIDGTSTDYVTGPDASVEYSFINNNYIYYSFDRLYIPGPSYDKESHQYDLSTSTDNFLLNEYGNVRRGRDSKIYISKSGSSADFATVDEPNSYALGTQASGASFQLTGGVSLQMHRLILNAVGEGVYDRMINTRNYELKDHLGNVRMVVSANKGASYPGSVTNFAEVKSYQDYYPFGMLMPGRNFNTPDYRFGFNGKEMDNETKGNGNSIDFGARIYDARIGRWMSVDPLANKYSGWSPYNFVADNPILHLEIDGMDWLKVTGNKVLWYGGNKGDTKTLLKVYKATSGFIGYQQAKYQNQRDKGPTPEGDYHINLKPNPDRVAKVDKNGDIVPSPQGGIEKIPELGKDAAGNEYSYSAWGENRAHLEPDKVTGAKNNERDNNSYYLHDSEKGYTHGCTESDPALIDKLKDYRKAGNEKIDVVVDYPDKEHSTNGGTEKKKP